MPSSTSGTCRRVTSTLRSASRIRSTSSCSRSRAWTPIRAPTAFVHDNLARVAREHHAWVLANATVDADPDGRRAENLDVLFDPDGEIVGTYTKHHLVPFGEYVPFRSELEGWIPALEEVPRDFVRGKTTGLFDVAGTRIATVICFESAFGHEVRSLVRDGAQVIVVSTNNRSYRRSANSAQHLAFAQIRAGRNWPAGRPSRDLGHQRVRRRRRCRPRPDQAVRPNRHRDDSRGDNGTDVLRAARRVGARGEPRGCGDCGHRGIGPAAAPTFRRIHRRRGRADRVPDRR